MAALVVALILVAVFFGLGFAIDVFWFAAIVLAALWLLGFLFRGAERTWYRW